MQATQYMVRFLAPDLVTDETVSRAFGALRDRLELGPIVEIPDFSAFYSAVRVAQNSGAGVLVQLDPVGWPGLTVTVQFQTGGKLQAFWPWEKPGPDGAPALSPDVLHEMVIDAVNALDPNRWEQAGPSRGAGMIPTVPEVMLDVDGDDPHRRVPFQLATPDVHTFADAMSATMDSMMVGVPADMSTKAFPGRVRLVVAELLTKPALMAFVYLGDGEDEGAACEVAFPILDASVDATVAGFFRDFTENGGLGPRMTEIVAEVARVVIEEPMTFNLRSRIMPEGESLHDVTRSIFRDNKFKAG